MKWRLPCSPFFLTRHFRPNWLLPLREVEPTGSPRDVFKACAALKELETGKKLHSDTFRCGYQRCISLNNSLINMYALCQSLELSDSVFWRMPCHDVVSWNSLILGYVTNGEAEMGLNAFFTCMKPSGCVPNARTFLALVTACTALAIQETGAEVHGESVKVKCLERGMALHSQAVTLGCESDVFLATKLVEMYATCGSLLDARVAFDRMTARDTVSWTSLLLGYVENGECGLAVQLFDCMDREGCYPDARTFVAALVACTSLAQEEIEAGYLEKGIAIHSQAASIGYVSDIFVANSLMDMYIRYGRLEPARTVFESFSDRDVVSWNVMILGYVVNGQSEVAVELFERMKIEGCTRSSRSFVGALMACVALAGEDPGVRVNGKLVRVASLEKGIDVHAQAVAAGHDTDNFVASLLVEMYSKGGCVEEARRVVEKLPRHDVVLWTGLILGYVDNGEEELALELFSCMLATGCQPTAPSFVAVLKACAGLAEKEEVHDGELVKPKCLETVTALHSQAVGYSCDSDLFVANMLVDLYSKCRDMSEAEAVFERMEHRSLATWNALIIGYVENGRNERALRCFRCLDLRPDARTYVGVLIACGNLETLETGRGAHGEICRLGLETDPFLVHRLVDFYGRCGTLFAATQTFETVNTRDVSTWSALITGHSRQGATEKVFHLLRGMKEYGVQVNGVTFISVLNACNHGGLVDEGKVIFEALSSVYGIQAELKHYHCVVDMLGRANYLEQAVEMLRRMPFEATVLTWTIVLGGCTKWRNLSVGEMAFRELLRLDEKYAPAYSMMANLYGSLGLWREQCDITERLKGVSCFRLARVHL